MEVSSTTRTVDSEPLTVETLPSGLAVDPTPIGSFYVRNNLAMPAGVKPSMVTLVGTGRDGEVGLEELFEGCPRVDTTAVLQCAGNGRSRLREAAPGVQWDVGGVGCGEWSGIRVADVVAMRGGVDPGARFLTALGGEADVTDPMRVERSIPLAKAMADALLVDRMNGVPLPVLHGGPLRLIVPGYFAVNSVKWLRRLAFTTDESDADIQQQRYRMTPPGEEPFAAHPSLWEMGPTSFILGHVPSDGGFRVWGVAFSGSGPPVGVEISSDGGATWGPAELVGNAQGRFGWRRFEAVVEMLGPRTVSRAVTATGHQPELSEPNRDGYAVDGWAELAYVP